MENGAYTANYMPTVKVLMAAYNAADTIVESARSVLNQCYQGKISLCIVNDGSTDNTQEIIEKLQLEFDRVKYRYLYHKVLPRNMGQAVARNKSFFLGKASEYVGFLDADDVWFSTAVTARLNVLMDEDSDLIYTPVIDQAELLNNKTYQHAGWKYIFRRNFLGANIVTGRERELLERGNIFFLNSVMMKSALFLQAGMFEPHVICGEDGILWRRSVAISEPSYIDEPVGFYISRASGNQSRKLHEFGSGLGFHLNPEVHGLNGQSLDQARMIAGQKYIETREEDNFCGLNDLKECVQ